MNAEGNHSIMAGYYRRKKHYIRVSVLLLLLVLVLTAIMMVYGNTIYSPQTIWRVLLGEEIQGAVFTIKTLRLPRMLAAVLCGIAFGMAGNTFQLLLGNPLASPDIIGVTSGASVAAVFGILVLRLSGNVISIMAVVTGIIVAGLIYLLSQGSGFSNGRLILTGIGAQAFLNSLISWMLLKASEYDVSSALRWLSGSLNGVTIDKIPGMAAAILLSGCGILLLHRHLTILQLGDAHAVTLGINRNVTRLLLILLALIQIAFATAVTGPISSVAFLSGPIAGRLSGYGKSNMLTASLVGTILVLAADLVGQFLFPTSFPVGVITGVLGAPYLLWLLLRMNKS